MNEHTLLVEGKYIHMVSHDKVKTYRGIERVFENDSIGIIVLFFQNMFLNKIQKQCNEMEAQRLLI